MAHNIHYLPWQTLSDDFKYIYKNSRYHGKTNYYPRHKQGQSKRLNYFAIAFAKAIEQFAVPERRKYPESFPITGPDDIVISEASSRKIQKTIDQSLPDHGKISSHERQLSFWLDRSGQCGGDALCWDCGPGPYLDKKLEIFKALILHGQIRDALNISANHPNLFKHWDFENKCQGYGHNGGWGQVARTALLSYVCLNFLYSKPECWDPGSRKCSEVDYRFTAAYQKTLVICTAQRYSNVYQLPHRFFYGCSGDRYPWPETVRWQPHGGMAWKALIHAFGIEKTAPQYLCKMHERLHSQDEVDQVLYLLRRKGLPTELALMVLDQAKYKAGRRLRIAEEPLHPDNYSELSKYLRYCWKLMVWSDLIAKQNGKRIDWANEVKEVIWELVGVEYPRMIERNRYRCDWEDEEGRGWIDDWKRGFIFVG